jgi:hypothetical protein
MRRLKKLSGDQPGNQNARKHGFYSEFLTQDEQHLVDGITEAPQPDLKYEIALLRIRIASIEKNAPDNDDLFLSAVNSLRRLVTANHKFRRDDILQYRKLAALFLKNESKLC